MYRPGGVCGDFGCVFSGSDWSSSLAKYDYDVLAVFLAIVVKQSQLWATREFLKAIGLAP